MKKLLYTSLLATFLLLAGLGCKRQEPKPDLCKDIKPLTADFTISEAPPFFSEYWIDNDTDTIGTYGAKFTATCDYCEYEWILEADTIRTKSFTKVNFPLNIPIEVSLKVKAKTLPRNYFDCVQDRKLEDENTRTFVNVIPGRRYLGKYYGTDVDRPNEPYTIEVYMIVLNPCYSNEREDIYVKGLVKPDCDCGTISAYIISGFQQSFLPLNCTGECMKPIVLFNFETNEEVTITYHLFGEYDWDIKDRPKIATKTFKGRRIQ